MLHPMADQDPISNSKSEFPLETQKNSQTKTEASHPNHSISV